MGQTVVRCITAVLVAAIVSATAAFVITEIDVHVYEYNLAVLHAESQLFDAEPGKGM